MEGGGDEGGDQQLVVRQEAPAAPSQKALASNESILYLKCCMCDRVATRKCQGLLNNEDIEEIIQQLKKSSKHEWLQVIQRFSRLASEQKLVLLIEQIIYSNPDGTTDILGSHGGGGDNDSVDGNETVSSAGGHHKHGHHGHHHSHHHHGSHSANQSTTDSFYNTLSPNQLQQIRNQLEKLRTECDECYCSDCYGIVHSGGKRALHHWQGFQEYAIVCSVCQSYPADFSCVDCMTATHHHAPNELMEGESDSVTDTKLPSFLQSHHNHPNQKQHEGIFYCSSCFHVYHTIGRKKRHKKDIVYETNMNNPLYLQDQQSATSNSEELIVPEDIYCGICYRRLAKKCPNEECQVKVCEECFEFRHRKKCRFKPPSNEYQDPNSIRKPLKKTMSMSRSESNLLQSNKKEMSFRGGTEDNQQQQSVEYFCVVCNEAADKKCLQCGDYYCSRTWMGNPGCFIQFHSKGNRATHQTIKISEMSDPNRKPVISFTTLLEQGKMGVPKR
jgi:hypothetical protein